MGKVLFLKSRTLDNDVLKKTISERIDSIFMGIQENAVLKAIETEDISLIVIYLKDVTENEKVEISKILLNVVAVPYVLAGLREDLHKYFVANVQAKILRFIKTPILLSAFVKEIQSVLEKVDGTPLSEKAAAELAKKEIVEKEEPRHILVVDDSVVVLRTISSVLNGLFKVSVAKSGAAAISFLAKEHPDLILLDYQMPVCDGLQTLEMIRAEEDYKDVPVFFLTGVDDADLVKRAMALKPEGYILKSAGTDLLISKIEAFF